MEHGNLNHQTALQNFQDARIQAALLDILGRLTGRSNQLLSYEDVARKLKLSGRADHGIQRIPVDAIVGSVGRYTDFTRTFLPREKNDRQRWPRIGAAELGTRKARQAAGARPE